MKFSIIIPVYNSERHISGVIEAALQHADNIIVVNDGSTDGTLDAINNCILAQQRSHFCEEKNDRIVVISYLKNRGKGYALKCGFRKALQLGFTHAVTMDADGQHLHDDIPIMLQAATKNPNSLIVGSRKFNNPNMPEENKFANNFSNFWFKIQTRISLPDTQTGFRVYPLLKMGKMHLFTSRYEAELELLVRCAWRNIKFISQPVNVYYPPKNERLSHFRKRKDFVRISILNMVLCFVAIIYGYPRTLINKLIQYSTNFK